MIEDRGPVLGAHVGALPVERRRIVQGEKHVEQIAEGNHRGIEGDLHHLGVTGRAGADLFVVGIGRGAAGVARFDFGHTLEKFESGFEAPEAAAGEGGQFGRTIHVSLLFPHCKQAFCGGVIYCRLIVQRAWESANDGGEF